MRQTILSKRENRRENEERDIYINERKRKERERYFNFRKRNRKREERKKEVPVPVKVARVKRRVGFSHHKKVRLLSILFLRFQQKPKKLQSFVEKKLF